MKPNFALTLSFETIALLRRTSRGWMMVDEVATDSADLTDALSYMRASALGLSPQGVATKLVLPASEVLFTEVVAPGPDPAARRAQVAAALEGMTPYAVSDLVYDIAGDGPRVQVAVAARETLDQAEAFAVQHRFNPVSFVAVPPRGAFAGEPFFGETKAAPGFMAPGTAVERDAEPVVVLTRDALREAADRPTAPEAKAKAPESKAPESKAPATNETGANETGANTAKDRPAAASPAGTEAPDAVAAPDAGGGAAAGKPDAARLTEPGGPKSKAEAEEAAAPAAPEAEASSPQAKPADPVSPSMAAAAAAEPAAPDAALAADAAEPGRSPGRVGTAPGPELPEPATVVAMGQDAKAPDAKTPDAPALATPSQAVAARVTDKAPALPSAAAEIPAAAPAPEPV
ncbi:MAG TPA: hypothetical protein PKD10_11500, partial [Paracoccaceae bacterium]|nr:hypothetical protein [Paracoccaceae bacterium]